jgi:subtilase family serine protease
MKDARLLATVAILTTAGLLMPPRLSSAMSQRETAAIAGNHPNIALTGWNPAPGGMVLHMMMVLALRNHRELAELKTHLHQSGSPNYHKWLSGAEFIRRFGPTQQQMNEVTNWLGANDFTIDNANLATRTVRFSGTTSQAERAFSMEIVSNAKAYTNVSDPRLPTRLAGTIAAIFGLSRLPSDQRMSLAGLEGADAPAAAGPHSLHFTPQDFWTYYDQSSPTVAGNNGGTAAGDCIALLENFSIQPAEFQSFATQFGLPPVNLSVALTPSSTIAFDTKHHEVELDVEWAHAVAPNTQITLYISNDPTSLQQQFEALDLAVTQNACGAISSSIHDGGNHCADFAQIEAYAEIESQAVVQGQTFFHASGDFGSFFDCGQPAGSQGVTGVQPSIDETASGPDVTNVGGTQFAPAFVGGVNTSILKPEFEQVWNEFPPVTALPSPTPVPTKGGSTGGISTVFGKPTWQEGFPAYGLTPGQFTMRGVPDVASLGNGGEPGLWTAACFSNPCPETPPFAIKLGGGCPAGQQLCFIGDGGTSAGSPVWAGISRLLAQNLGTTRLGNINPQLYCLAGVDSPALVDVSLLGQNCPQAGLGCTIYPGYQVGPGYDLATGLGSADINKLIAAFPPTAPTASVTSSNTTSSGSAGQTIGGGAMTLTNIGSAPETVSTLTLNVSNPALFASLSLSASVDGGPGQEAVSGPLGSMITFVFAPAVTVPAGGAASLTLRVRMADASKVVSRSSRPASTIFGSGRGARELAAVLGLIGLGLILVPGGNRRRIRFFSAMFLLIAATQVGCGGDSEGLVGTSVQSVPACGVAVSNTNGAVAITGLPATLGQTRLVN